MRLENSFQVAVPIHEAWTLLNDVPRVVPCMPGAELLETLGEDSWKGVVRVRLGPVSLQFDADVARSEQDRDAHRIVLLTKARESRGRGSAQATIDSNLTEVEGGTLVRIVTDISLQGPVAQYGRGILPDIASQLTREFADNLSTLLARQDGSD